MTMNDLRTQALRELIGELSLAAFADRYDLNASYLSQILNGHRPFGERSARNMEEKIGLPAGSLSTPSSTEVADAAEGQMKFLMPARAGELDIPQYDVRAAMGAGQVLPSDYIETVRHLTVKKEFLIQQGCVFSKPENLCVITGFGESMSKTFASGDPLIVDRGINSIEVDGVYFFSLDGHLMIKRMQIIAGGVRVISDHEAYPPYDIKGADLELLVVHARVLIAWRSQRL